MKPLFFAIAILPWLFSACTTVTFEEPQPASNAALTELPSGLQGNYYDFDNRQNLIITSGLVYTLSIGEDTIPVNRLSSFELWKGDSITNTQTGRSYSVNKINDTLFTGYQYLDTLFDVKDKGCVLKNEGDDYFLNHKEDENAWSVCRLALRGDVINLRDISTENEVKMMERITGQKSDSVRPFLVRPTKEQFQKFVAQNGFIQGRTYLKMDSLIFN